MNKIAARAKIENIFKNDNFSYFIQASQEYCWGCPLAN